MSEMKRRDFLKSGTMAVAAAGVAAAIPIMPAVINAVDTDGPELDTTTAASTSEAAASMSEPLIVRINDLRPAPCRCSSAQEKSPMRTPNLQLASSGPPSDVVKPLRKLEIVLPSSCSPNWPARIV